MNVCMDQVTYGEGGEGHEKASAKSNISAQQPVDGQDDFE